MSDPICAWCKQPAKGLATIGDDHYCHEGDSPTCYELVSWATVAGLDRDKLRAAKGYFHPSAILAGFVVDQHQQWKGRHSDPTFAGAQALERLNDDRRRDAQALRAAHDLAQEWINDDAEPATDHGVTSQLIRASCGQQLLAALTKAATDPAAGGESDSFSKTPSTSPAAVARDFANWVATQRAYNGSDHEHGQSLYNDCINAVLSTWAEEWAAEQATSAPAQPDDGSNRLRDEEAEQILRAADDPNLPDDVFDVIEQILAAHVRSAESSRERAMHSRAEWRRRAEELEQEREFAAAAAADAVAKLDHLQDADHIAKALLALDRPASTFEQLTNRGRAKWRSRAQKLTDLLGKETS